MTFKNFLPYFVLGVAVLLQPVAWAATTCVTPPSTLVSWWTGDSDESDLYGVNNPSAVNAVGIVPAEVSNGFLFGTGSYIDIPASPSLANQRFTLAAWVMPAGPGPNDDQFGSLILSQDIDNFDGSAALWWRDNPDDRFLFGFGNDGTEVIYSNDTFPPGKFYFVAATYDGTTFRLYVNGVLEGSFAETKKIAYSNRTWEIGSADAPSRAEGYPRTWNGVIDEVQMYKAALSATSLTNIYKAGPIGQCKAAVIVTPASETFASQSVGTTSPAKNVTITNNRNTSITMDGFTFTGTNPMDFAQSSTTCSASLGARKTCKVGVTFTPLMTGKRTAILNVNDSAAGSPQTVGLSGTGK